MQREPSNPDLSEHEEEAIPFDDVMRRLIGAKPAPMKASKKPESSLAED